MGGEILCNSPQKIVLLRNSLYIQHHQLGRRRSPAADRVLCARDWRFEVSGVARRYHAAHLVWNAREPSRIGYVCVSSQAAEYLPGNV